MGLTNQLGVWGLCPQPRRADCQSALQSTRQQPARPVLRGPTEGVFVRCAHRNRNNPDNRNDNRGFRVVLLPHGFQLPHSTPLAAGKGRTAVHLLIRFLPVGAGLGWGCQNSGSATACPARRESRCGRFLAELFRWMVGVGWPGIYKRGLFPAGIRSTARLEQSRPQSKVPGTSESAGDFASYC